MRFPTRACCWFAALGMLTLGASSVWGVGFSNQGVAWFPPNGLNLDARSASLADIDGDGDLDAFFQGPDKRLYRNNTVGTGSPTFSNVSSLMPLTTVGPSWSAAWGDYDGDHRIDVFIGQSNTGAGQLAAGDVMHNEMPSGFANTSAAIGLNDPGFHQNVAWSDIDGDRDLDLVIGMEGPEPHEIYRQGAGGAFAAMGAASGLHVPYEGSLYGKGYGLALGDTDGDGDVDMYISTCRTGGNIRNNFFKNMLVETGSLSFEDIADSNGTQYLDNSYGAEFHDFDDDGDLDLFVVGADREPSKLFRNNGGNMFTDVAQVLGHEVLPGVGGDFNGGRAVDYDNDGDLDLFVHDHLAYNDGIYASDAARKLFRNNGNWNFEDVTAAVGLETVNMGAYDSVWGDIDLDGDQDLLAPTNGNWNERLFVSDASTNGNHWLYVRLAGPTENTTGIGAALYATIDEGTPQERTLRRDANANAGTFNQSDLPVHFGLGDAVVIDRLEIRWPDGTVQTLRDVPVDDYLTIRTPGDFNGDGRVDALDLAQWEGDFGVDDGSDSDYDGLSDGGDFLAWQRALGNGVRPAAGAADHAVPEPTTAALLGVVAMWGGRRMRDSRRR